MPKKIIQITIILIAVFAINFSLSSIKADTYKKEGKESLKENFPYIAVDKFNKALKMDSSDGEARGYLGISYSSLAEKANKGELLKKAIYEMQDARKTYEDSSINYHLAKTYELSGDVDNAIQEAVKSYGQIPSSEARDKLISLYKRKGDILLAQNKKDDAIKYYTEFVKLKGVNISKEDVTDYEFLRNLIPDNFFIRYSLAKLYIGQSQWGKAVIELEYIIKIGISNEDIMSKLIQTYYNMGNKFYTEKKFKEAEEYLNYIIRENTTGRFCCLLSAIHILSYMYEQSGNLDKAEKILMKLEGIDTQKGQGYYYIGQLFSRKSDPQKAIEYFEKYLPFRPISDSSIFITLGSLYEKVGNINKAVEYYYKLENINSSKGDGHYNIGLLYEKEGRWDDAINEFEYAFQLRPDNSEMLLKIGQLYEKTRDNRKALEMYKKAISIDPLKEAELNLSIAKLYEKIDNREKALSLFKMKDNIIR
jgi:tetratricopeptide (TPR) repeat protein